MSLKRSIFRALNRALAVGGLRLDRLERDFDDAPLDAFTQARLAATLANAFETCVGSQTILEPRLRFDIPQVVRTFLRRLAKWPVSRAAGRQPVQQPAFAAPRRLGLFCRDVCRQRQLAGGKRLGPVERLSIRRQPAIRHRSALAAPKLRAEASTVSNTTGCSCPASRVERLLCYSTIMSIQVRRLVEASDRGCAGGDLRRRLSADVLLRHGAFGERAAKTRIRARPGTL